MPVVSECPVHGAFRSNKIVIEDSRLASLAGNIETCPVPGCGRISRIMEGTFDFDVDGLARVIAAPEWTRQALAEVQQDLQQAARALRDEQNYSDARAYSVLDGRLAKIEAQNGELGRAVADAIRTAKKRTPRATLWQVVGAIAVAAQVMSGLPATIENTIDYASQLVQWGISLFEVGQEPLPHEAPAPPSFEPNEQV